MMFLAAWIPFALTSVPMKRGTVALVPGRQPEHCITVPPNAEGEDCSRGFTQARFDEAMRDALAHEPEADALVDVTLSIDRKCYRVAGKPVRVLSAPAQ